MGRKINNHFESLEVRRVTWNKLGERKNCDRSMLKLGLNI